MIIAEIPAVREREHRYVLRVILGEFLGIPYQAVVTQGSTIRLRVEGAASGSILLDDGFLTMGDDRWLADQSLPPLPLKRFDTRTSPFQAAELPAEIPILYGTKRGERWIEQRGEDLCIDIDIFGAAFFCLTRYEEIVRPERDTNGRFPAKATIAVQEGFERLPIVNVYTELLWAAMSATWPTLQRTPRAGRTFLSHDVDWPLVTQGVSLKAAAKSAAGDIMVRRAPDAAAFRLAARLAPARFRERLDPGSTFAFLMDQSERRGLKSAFYFIAKNTVGFLDGTYRMDDPFIRRLLRQIHDRGHEIGLHPGYGSYQDDDLIAASARALHDACEAERIVQPAWGGRQHYLRWEAPTTWRLWDEAGMAYDSTVGYAETVGFRSGTCYEYPVFDVVNRTELRLRERPLVVMEVSLFDRTSQVNMAMSDDEALDVLRELNATVRRFNGDMTLLWHNSTLISQGQKRLYRQAVDVLTQSGQT